MLELLKNMLTGRNQFASGGLLLMMIGALSVYLHAVRRVMWDWIVSQVTMMVTVTDDDTAFVWMKEWFLEQKFLKRIRRVDLDTTLRGERVALIPAPGCHWFWYGGRPFQVWFFRHEEVHKLGARRTESLTFRTLGRKRLFLQEFVDDVVSCHMKRIGAQTYLYIYNEGWDYVEGYAPRTMESVVLGPGEKEHLLRDVARFRQSGERYTRLGVPYHRGYLLYGPPGTGKTSLVSALAAHFGLSIYAVNLTDFSDRSLIDAVSRVPANSVLLFEDIDCAKGGRTREVPSSPRTCAMQTQERQGAAANGVTLSGLLNVLDGFYAPDSVLFMMTTNQVDVLDEALLRPGRIDYRLHLGKASDLQKVELYRRFFPWSSRAEALEFVEISRSAVTMAEFQGLLLRLEEERRGAEPEVALSGSLP